MSTLPRDVRIQALHEVGVKIDDTLESARLETARREGAHAAYVNAAKALSAHPEAAAICSSLASQAHNLVFAAKGAEIQSKSLVALLKGLHDLEVARKQRETEPLPEADSISIQPPRRRTIKEERLAEEAAAAPKKPSARRK